MNGAPTQIEIIQPFEKAFVLMKRMLFQPFDLKKWCVIGFAAFLSGAFGGGFGFTPPIGNHPHNNNAPGPANFQQWKDWMPTFIVAAVGIGLAMILLIIWLRSRGTFIFTDCVVRNRAAIVAPWREFRKEGNSYFKFHLALMLISMAIVVAIAIPVGVAAALSGWNEHPLSGVIGGIGIGLLVIVWLIASFFLAIIVHFMPPVMYIRRCDAIDAFREVCRLVSSRPGPFVLFALFGIALLLGLSVTSGIITCATCCIGALPYIGTVLLLPAYLWLRAYTLLFLRQFGPEYDVWNGQPPAHELAPPITQGTPPPLPT